jgi:hypothetical protein
MPFHPRGEAALANASTPLETTARKNDPCAHVQLAQGGLPRRRTPLSEFRTSRSARGDVRELQLVGRALAFRKLPRHSASSRVVSLTNRSGNLGRAGMFG